MKKINKLKFMQKTIGVFMILASLILFIGSYQIPGVVSTLAGIYCIFTKDVIFEDEYKIIAKTIKGARS